MKRNYRLKALFAPQERFQPEIRKGVLPLEEVTSAFEKQKTQLASELVHEATDPKVAQRILDAIRNAEAEAWATPYPTLFMTELTREKAREARLQAKTQERVHRQSEAIVALIA